MSTQLGVGQPVGLPPTPPPEPVDQPPTMTDWLWSDILAWTKFVLSLVLGVALGAVNLTAFDANGLLRVPALLAALILCAQGPVDLGEHQRHKEALTEAETEALKRWYAAQRAKAEVEERRQHAREGGREAMVERIPSLSSEVAVNESTTDIETAELGRQDKKQDAEARVSVGSVAESRGGLLTVLVLAIWLGLATLNYPQSPPLLLWLSLVAAFLLFMSVWGGLQRRPAAP